MDEEEGGSFVGDGPEEPAVFLEVEEGADGLLGFALDGFEGVEGVVGGEEDVGAVAQPEEGLMVGGEGRAVAGAQGGGEGGFPVVDVEGDAGEEAFLQGRFEDGGRGEFAPGDVDEDGLALGLSACSGET